jgi:hypothetical protein
VRIVLFSANQKVKDAFGTPALKGKVAIEVRTPSELVKALRCLSRDCLVYFDVAKLGEAEIGGVSRLLGKTGLPHGFVDPGDRVRDVALLFQRGASDFIGGRILKHGIDSERFKRAFAKHPAADRQAAGGGVHARAKTRKAHPKSRRTVSEPSERKSGLVETPGENVPSAASWADIEEGREYLFCLMYIELDSLAELRKSLGEKNILLTVKTFRDYVERSIASHGGRLWMWKEFTGLALFPFDGSRCDAVTPCLRLMLANRIFSADLPFLSASISYRIALHIGGTVYRRKGDTGEIVSDALNSVFHLGRKFLEPGNFYITKPVYEHAPEGLKKCFLEAGVFEGSVIMRMRLPRLPFPPNHGGNRKRSSGSFPSAV